MPKSRMVVTNPVDKIDPNKVKELIARLGQKSGTAPASEDNKKVKKRSGTGNRGDGSGKPNDPSGGNSPDDIGSNSTKRWHPSSRNTNGTDIPNYPFQTRKSKIRRSKIGKSEVDGISGADIGDINAERFYDYGSTISLRKEAKDNLKNGTSLTPWKKVTDGEPFKAERFYDYGQYNPSTNPNTIGGDGRLRKKYPPQLFWGALIGAGINMASSLIGGISAKKQAAEQAKIAEQQRLKAEAEANLASDQVQLKSYVPSNNPGYFAAGGTIENNSFTPNQYGVNISPNAQFLTNADGSTNGDHSTGNEVPIYNKDKKLIALAHPREILYTKPDGDQVVLSEAKGYSTAYNNLQNMINERKVKLFKTRKDPKGDISRDIQDLVKAQVGLVAKQEEDSANPNQMKCGGGVRRKADGGSIDGWDIDDGEILSRYDPSPISKRHVNFSNQIPVKSTLIDFTKREAEYKNPIIYGNYSGPAIKPTITFEQKLEESDLIPRKITDPNPVQTWLDKQPISTWDKIKGVIKDPAVQNAGINTLGNLASNIATNSYLSAADKTVSGMKPVHVRYAPINERVDTSGQEANAQNAYNSARSEINNVTDPTRRSALLNDLTSRYVSNTNEIAGSRINAEISKQNANITAANQVSAQNAANENAMNQYKTEAKAGILGAKSTNMGSMMTKIMQGIQDYRLGQNDKAKLDMVLQRFKSGVADRMDYDALENIFGIIKGKNKDGK